MIYANKSKTQKFSSSVCVVRLISLSLDHIYVILLLILLQDS